MSRHCCMPAVSSSLSEPPYSWRSHSQFLPAAAPAEGSLLAAVACAKAPSLVRYEAFAEGWGDCCCCVSAACALVLAVADECISTHMDQWLAQYNSMWDAVYVLHAWQGWQITHLQRSTLEAHLHRLCMAHGRLHAMHRGACKVEIVHLTLGAQL